LCSCHAPGHNEKASDSLTQEKAKERLSQAELVVDKWRYYIGDDTANGVDDRVEVNVAGEILHLKLDQIVIE
jgi:hypothetical protein